MIYKTVPVHIKLKIEQHKLTKDRYVCRVTTYAKCEAKGEYIYIWFDQSIEEVYNDVIKNVISKLTLLNKRIKL